MLSAEYYTELDAFRVALFASMERRFSARLFAPATQYVNLLSNTVALGARVAQLEADEELDTPLGVASFCKDMNELKATLARLDSITTATTPKVPKVQVTTCSLCDEPEPFCKCYVECGTCKRTRDTPGVQLRRVVKARYDETSRPFEPHTICRDCVRCMCGASFENTKNWSWPHGVTFRCHRCPKTGVVKEDLY